MKIEQLDTPFLYLDEDGGGECVAIHPAYLPSHLPGAKQTEALRPHKMEVNELQHALGLDSLVERIRSIEMDASGCAVFSRPKWTCSDDAFAEQRQAWLRPPLSPPGPRIPAPFSSPLTHAPLCRRSTGARLALPRSPKLCRTGGPCDCPGRPPASTTTTTVSRMWLSGSARRLEQERTQPLRACVFGIARHATQRSAEEKLPE